MRVTPEPLGSRQMVVSADGFATLSNVSSARSPARVVIRRQIRGQITNGWLVLIAVLGVAIVVVDGLSRGPNLDLELFPPQPLEYQPYQAAFLLAGLTLPPMFAYARRARVSLVEALFLWFVFCTTAYTKDFAYLRWPGTPLFVTDVVLVFLLFSTCILPRRTFRSNDHLPLPMNVFLVLFVAAGVLAAARGFFGYREPVLVLRDSALIVYPLFVLVGYQLIRSWAAVKRVAIWFVLGASLSVLNGLAWLVAAPEQRRFIAPGIYVLISLVGVVIMMANRLIRPLVGWIFAGIFSVGLLLANARSLFVSLVVLFLVVLFVPGMLRRKFRSARLATTLVTAAFVGCTLVFLFLPVEAGRDFAARVADNQASGVLHTSDDPFWQFRLTAWREAWRRFQEYPPAGEGFGIPFNFEIWDNDPRPHNTFLTVLYKMGLLGLLPLLALLAYFFWLCLRTIRRNSTKPSVPVLQALALAQVSLCVWGGADAMLESPYLASLFWVGIGIALRMIQRFDFERSIQSIANPNCLEPKLQPRIAS